MGEKMKKRFKELTYKEKLSKNQWLKENLFFHLDFYLNSDKKKKDVWRVVKNNMKFSYSKGYRAGFLKGYQEGFKNGLKEK